MTTEKSGIKTLQKKLLTMFSVFVFALGLFTLTPALAKNGADDAGPDDRGGRRSSSSSDDSGRDDSGRNRARTGVDGAHQNRGSGDDDFGRNSVDDNSGRVSAQGVFGEDNPDRLNDDRLKVSENETDRAFESGDDRLAGVDDNSESGSDKFETNDDNQKGFFSNMTDRFVAFMTGLFN